MHGRTFNVLRVGEVVTVWGEGPHRGKRGYVCNTIGGVTWGKIVVKFDNGVRATINYKDVAMGDNEATAKI